MASETAQTAMAEEVLGGWNLRTIELARIRGRQIATETRAKGNLEFVNPNVKIYY